MANRPRLRHWGCFCLVVAIETSQHLLYKNVFEWWDVRDDTIGVAFAGMLIRWTGVKSLLLKRQRLIAEAADFFPALPLSRARRA